MMKMLAIAVMVMMTCGLLVAASYAVHEGDVGSSAVLSGEGEKGMTLFNDAKFAGATSGKSCGSCHPGGKGLEKAGEKKEFTLGGKKQNSIEEAVNFCIVNAIKGKAIDAKSDQMRDIVSYIKSLKKTK